MDIDSLRTRQAAIEGLWHDIDAHVRETSAPQLPVPVMKRYVYDLLSQLVTRESIPWDEWTSMGGADLITGDPFQPILHIDDKGVRLDRDRFAIDSEDMYAWHFEVFDAVRAHAAE
jgi:hypothetical protein